MARGDSISVRPIGTLASVFLDPGQDVDEPTGFQDVPASDKGSQYGDYGMRGSYTPEHRNQFPDPEGLKRFAGYGADEADLSQGFCSVRVNDDPHYDAINYRARWTLPRQADEQNGNTEMMPDDYEFRGRNRKTRGLFTRPHLPTER